MCVSLLFVLLFVAAAEWTFWDEFQTRFNFIAVDYLVYTNEVLANIREVPILIGALAALRRDRDPAIHAWTPWLAHRV